MMRIRKGVPELRCALFYAGTLLEGTHFLQQSLLKSSDLILKSSNPLSLKLRSWLAITAAPDYNMVNRTRRENLQISYRLTAGKYF